MVGRPCPHEHGPPFGTLAMAHVQFNGFAEWNNVSSVSDTFEVSSVLF